MKNKVLSNTENLTRKNRRQQLRRRSICNTVTCTSDEMHHVRCLAGPLLAHHHSDELCNHIPTHNTLPPLLVTLTAYFHIQFATANQLLAKNI